MFQGEYGLNAAPFWQPVHPVTLILFIVTLVLNRKTDRLKLIALPFITYFLILIITAVYFVPELIDIIQTPYQSVTDPVLQSRAEKWEILSLIRLFVLILSSTLLLTALTKPANNK
jgi:hypothetical protein